jgi:hypothetical protein
MKGGIEKNDNRIEKIKKNEKGNGMKKKKSKEILHTQ